MPQSHACQPRWSRHPDGVPQQHLREAVSSTVRTPGALAKQSARRKPKFERLPLAEIGGPEAPESAAQRDLRVAVQCARSACAVTTRAASLECPCN